MLNGVHFNRKDSHRQGPDAFEGNAKITGNVNAGMVVASFGYWRQSNKGTVNCCNPAELFDLGYAQTYLRYSGTDKTDRRR